MKKLTKIIFHVCLLLLGITLVGWQPIHANSGSQTDHCSDADKIAVVQHSIDAILQGDAAKASVDFSEDGRLWFDNVPEFNAESGEFVVNGSFEAIGPDVEQLMAAIISVVDNIQLDDVDVDDDLYTAKASVTSTIYKDAGFPSDTVIQDYTIQFQGCKIIDWHGTYPEETLEAADEPNHHDSDDKKSTKLAKLQKANKALVTAYIDDIFVKGELQKIDDYIADDCKIYQAFLGDLTGPAGIATWANNYWAAFKEPKFTLASYASGEDLVFVDWSWTAVDAETGTKPFEVERAVDMYRVKDGKIVEIFDMIDTLAFSQQ